MDVLPYMSPVRVGDIIVFHAPTSPSRDFVKRVIAGSGQTVTILLGSAIQVDGITISEPYARGPTNCSGTVCTFAVPAHSDSLVPNPSSSPISTDAPNFDNTVCENTACYFVMGDNRPNSSDSRQGWLVPVDNIIGYVNPNR